MEAHLREADFRDDKWLDIFVYAPLAAKRQGANQIESRD